MGRDSRPKSLGIKIHEGQTARTGMVIVRQRGTKYLPGNNVKRAGDDTLYAMKNGQVKFRSIKKTRFDGNKRLVKVVDIVQQNGAK